MSHAQMHFVSQPSPQSITAATGHWIRLSAEARDGNTYASAVAYQWYLNGAPVLEGTALQANYDFVLGPETAGTYTVKASNGELNVAYSEPAFVAIGGPGSPFAGQSGNPTSAQISAGQAFQLWAGAFDPAATYQWYKDGAPFTAADNHSITLRNVKPSQTGQYFCRITKDGVSTDTNPTTLVVAETAPAVLNTVRHSRYYWSGASGSAPEMSGLLLLASTGGSGPFQYQWSRNGIALEGETKSTLEIALTSPQATYGVTIANSLGSDTATFKPLNVNSVTPTLPLVDRAPVAQTVRPGERLVLSADAYGSAPITYQWFKDNTLIPGATSRDYTVVTATPADTGAYSVKATNSYGVSSLGLEAAHVHVVPSADWSLLNGHPTARNLNAVAYGAGLFIAAGDRGTILTSTNGSTWSRRETPTTANLRAVAFGGGKFVATGDRGVILTSLDGSAWTLSSVLTTEDCTGVAYRTGRFVVVGKRGTILTATDDLVWGLSDSGQQSADYAYVTASGDRFIAGAAKILSDSSDGISWSNRSVLDPGLSTTFRLVKFADNRFEMFCNAAAITRSADGLQWFSIDAASPNDVADFLIFKSQRIYAANALYTQGASSTFAYPVTGFESGWNAVASSSSVVVAVGNAGQLARSTDGLSWTWVNQPPSTTTFTRVERLANGAYVAFPEATAYPGPILSSPDGRVWTPVTNPRPSYILRSFTREGVMRVLDADSRVWKTTDGQNWTRLPLAVNTVPMAYGDGRYVFFGYGSLYSLDGETWVNADKSQVAGTWTDGRAVAYGNGYFVALGSTGHIARSPDGITWSSTAKLAGTQFRDIAFGNGLFLVVGPSGCYRSVDGITWQPVANLGTGSASRVRYFNQKFHVPTNGGWVLLSSDGVTWSKQYACDQPLGDIIPRPNFGLIAVGEHGYIFTDVKPVRGDFNADGQSDLVWQNRTTGERRIWLMNGTTLAVDPSLGTLPLEWSIVANGDFNADGQGDLAWTNTATGEHRLWIMNGTTLAYDVSLGAQPLQWKIDTAGDFNGDGKADLVWTNSQTGERRVWIMDGDISTDQRSLGVLPLEWAIAGSGDFNRDGNTDLVWQNTVTGERRLWIMNGNSLAYDVSLGTLPLEWTIVGSGDFNADEKSDLVWTNQATGERRLWMMDGTSLAYDVSLGAISLDWTLGSNATTRLPVADFNGDAKSDLVWTNTATGERYLWLMNDAAFGSSVSLGAIASEWQIATSADFNTDGKSDLVWVNTATGECYVWLMDGTALSSSVSLGTVPTDWSIAAAGDFNADGKSDLAWQNTTTGERALWLMNGTAYASSTGLGTVGTEWSIAAAGDFNADRKADLVWQNITTGERYVWLMDGATLSSSVSLGIVPTAWSIAGSGDFNADGKADLVWQNTVTGERALWLMNGTNYTGSASLGVVPLEWKIVK